MFFYVTILKFANGFSKSTLSGKPMTFGTYQKHYQGNVHAYYLIKPV